MSNTLLKQHTNNFPGGACTAYLTQDADGSAMKQKLTQSQARILKAIEASKEGACWLGQRTDENAGSIHAPSTESLERRGLVKISMGSEERWARLTDKAKELFNRARARKALESTKAIQAEKAKAESDAPEGSAGVLGIIKEIDAERQQELPFNKPQARPQAKPVDATYKHFSWHDDINPELVATAERIRKENGSVFPRPAGAENWWEMSRGSYQPVEGPEDLTRHREWELSVTAASDRRR